MNVEPRMNTDGPGSRVDGIAGKQALALGN